MKVELTFILVSFPRHLDAGHLGTYNIYTFLCYPNIPRTPLRQRTAAWARCFGWPGRTNKEATRTPTTTTTSTTTTSSASRTSINYKVHCSRQLSWVQQQFWPKPVWHCRECSGSRSEMRLTFYLMSSQLWPYFWNNFGHTFETLLPHFCHTFAKHWHIQNDD